LQNSEIVSKPSHSWDTWARLGAHRHIKVRRFANPEDKEPGEFEIAKLRNSDKWRGPSILGDAWPRSRNSIKFLKESHPSGNRGSGNRES
jgi:hypothetical protein